MSMGGNSAERQPAPPCSCPCSACLYFPFFYWEHMGRAMGRQGKGGTEAFGPFSVLLLTLFDISWVKGGSRNFPSPLPCSLNPVPGLLAAQLPLAFGGGCEKCGPWPKGEGSHSYPRTLLTVLPLKGLVGLAGIPVDTGVNLDLMLVEFALDLHRAK